MKTQVDGALAEDQISGHSIKFLEMAFRNDRHGTIEQPDGYGSRKGDCGDRVEFFIKACGESIEKIAVSVDGCMNTNACANTVAEFCEGKNIDQAWKITPEIVARYLESLPEDHFHCAELAVGAYYRALADWQRLGKKGWKKNYRKFPL